MRCVVAAEPEAAELIRDNLIKTGLYKDWEFYTCTDARELFAWSAERPDVVLVSRFLPGVDADALVKRLKEFFPASHVVLLVGEVDEKCRAYIKLAHDAGVYNIVTGRLPGDRPYTILAALKYSLEDGEFRPLVWDEQGEVLIGGRRHRELSRGSDLSGSSDIEPKEHKRYSSGDAGFKSIGGGGGGEDFTLEVADIKQIREKLLSEILQGGERAKTSDRYEARTDTRLSDIGGQLIVQHIESAPRAGYDYSLDMDGHGDAPVLDRLTRPDVQPPDGVPAGKGVLVLVAANKGGVGKTTVTVTIATALARAGIPVVLWDLDFGAPDIASFFNLRDARGIETLAGKPIKRQYIELILTQPEKNLYVVPGPMDKTLPAFRPEEIAIMARILTGMFPVTIGDTPPEFWIKPWRTNVFGLADKVLAVVDQSKFSEDETAAYAPCLIGMGVTPEKISIVLNKFSPKLHSAKVVEKCFNSGFRKEVPAQSLPKVVATIPEDWVTYVQKGYKGEVVGLEDACSQWHRLAAEIAGMAGYEYEMPEGDKRKGLLSFLRLR